MWRHKKGGLYVILGHGLHSDDLTPMVIYRSTEHETTWTRPASEFYDGRFRPEIDKASSPTDHLPDSVLRPDAGGD